MLKWNLKAVRLRSVRLIPHATPNFEWRRSHKIQFNNWHMLQPPRPPHFTPRFPLVGDSGENLWQLKTAEHHKFKSLTRSEKFSTERNAKLFFRELHIHTRSDRRESSRVGWHQLKCVKVLNLFARINYGLMRIMCDFQHRESSARRPLECNATRNSLSTDNARTFSMGKDESER